MQMVKLTINFTLDNQHLLVSRKNKTQLVNM
jgi:hypothetical protein